MAQETTRHNGFAIRDFRLAAGMSVADLAAAAGASPAHIRNIENEHKEASDLLLSRIARAVNCRVASLVRTPRDLEAEVSA